MAAKIVTARYYADCLLPQASAFMTTLVEGGPSAVAMPAERF
jgi:hypothetical protein